jgi:hypothetical protein
MREKWEGFPFWELQFSGGEPPVKKSEKQVPHRLKSVRDDKKKGRATGS